MDHISGCFGHGEFGLAFVCGVIQMGNSRVTVGMYGRAMDQSETYFRILDLDGDGRISKLKLLLTVGIPIFQNKFLLRFFPFFFFLLVSPCLILYGFLEQCSYCTALLYPNAVCRNGFPYCSLLFFSACISLINHKQMQIWWDCVYILLAIYRAYVVSHSLLLKHFF